MSLPCMRPISVQKYREHCTTYRYSHITHVSSPAVSIGQTCVSSLTETSGSLEICLFQMTNVNIKRAFGRSRTYRTCGRECFKAAKGIDHVNLFMDVRRNKNYNKKERGFQNISITQAEFGSSLREFQVLQLAADTRASGREREYGWYGCDKEEHSASSPVTSEQ
jgi:hypothetical protein